MRRLARIAIPDVGTRSATTAILLADRERDHEQDDGEEDAADTDEDGALNESRDEGDDPEKHRGEGSVDADLHVDVLEHAGTEGGDHEGPDDVGGQRDHHDLADHRRCLGEGDQEQGAEDGADDGEDGTLEERGDEDDDPAGDAGEAARRNARVGAEDAGAECGEERRPEHIEHENCECVLFQEGHVDSFGKRFQFTTTRANPNAEPDPETDARALTTSPEWKLECWRFHWCGLCE